jgi:hypothetical protein
MPLRGNQRSADGGERGTNRGCGEFGFDSRVPWCIICYLLGGIINFGWFIGVKFLNGGSYHGESPRVGDRVRLGLCSSDAHLLTRKSLVTGERSWCHQKGFACLYDR